MLLVHTNQMKTQKFTIIRLQEYDILSATSVVLRAQNVPKIVGGRGSAPDPAGGAYDAPPDPLVGWGGASPSPHPTPSAPQAPRFSRLRRSAPRYPKSLQKKFLCPPLTKSWLRLWPPQHIPWPPQSYFPGAGAGPDASLNRSTNLMRVTYRFVKKMCTYIRPIYIVQDPSLHTLARV
jgi:hypothetical protein